MNLLNGFVEILAHAVVGLIHLLDVNNRTALGLPLLIELPSVALNSFLLTKPEQRELAFPLTDKVLWYWFDKITEAAGVNGSAKWVRRTGATRVEQHQPGSAMAYLGHKTAGLAYQHYVDARQIQSNRPMPPPIDPAA